MKGIDIFNEIHVELKKDVMQALKKQRNLQIIHFNESELDCQSDTWDLSSQRLNDDHLELILALLQSPSCKCINLDISSNDFIFRVNY